MVLHAPFVISSRLMPALTVGNAILSLDPKCRYHEGSDHLWETIAARIVRPCPEHGTACRHAETLASLSGIIDPNDNDLRVIRAELASEVFTS